MGRLALARKHPTCRACHAGFKIWVAELELLVGWGGARALARSKLVPSTAAALLDTAWWEA